MLNVFQAVKKYEMGAPWADAASELALHPESGLFMHQGEYAVVELPLNFAFPPVHLTFLTAEGVMVNAGEDFACFETEDDRHCLWRLDALKKPPVIPPLVA